MMMMMMMMMMMKMMTEITHLSTILNSEQSVGNEAFFDETQNE
jgi:hypothetical protein